MSYQSGSLPPIPTSRNVTSDTDSTPHLPYVPADTEYGGPSSTTGWGGDVQIRALTALHEEKTKALMHSVNSLKKQVATLQTAARSNKRSEYMAALAADLRRAELVADVAKTELSRRTDLSIDQVDQLILKRSVGGPTRFRPKPREELATEVAALKAKYQTAAAALKEASSRNRSLQAALEAATTSAAFPKTGSGKGPLQAVTGALQRQSAGKPLLGSARKLGRGGARDGRPPSPGRQHVSASQDSATEQAQTIWALSAELEEVRAQLRAKDAQLTEQGGKVSQLMHSAVDLPQLQREHKAALGRAEEAERDLRASRTAHAEAVQQLEALRTELARVQDERDALSDEISAAKDFTGKSSAQAAQSQAALLAQLDARTRELQTARDECIEQQAAVENRDDVIADMQLEASELRSALEASQSVAEHLRSQLEAANSLAEELEPELADRRAGMAAMESTQAELEEALGAATEEARASKRQADEAAGALDAVKAEMQRLTEELAAAHSQIAQQVERIEALELELDAEQRMVRSLQARAAAADSEHAQGLTQKQLEMEELITKLKTDVQERNTRIAILEEQLRSAVDRAEAAEQALRNAPDEGLSESEDAATCLSTPRSARSAGPDLEPLRAELQERVHDVRLEEAKYAELLSQVHTRAQGFDSFLSNLDDTLELPLESLDMSSPQVQTALDTLANTLESAVTLGHAKPAQSIMRAAEAAPPKWMAAEGAYAAVMLCVVLQQAWQKYAERLHNAAARVLSRAKSKPSKRAWQPIVAKLGKLLPASALQEAPVEWAGVAADLDKSFSDAGLARAKDQAYQGQGFTTATSLGLVVASAAKVRAVDEAVARYDALANVVRLYVSAYDRHSTAVLDSGRISSSVAKHAASATHALQTLTTALSEARAYASTAVSQVTNIVQEHSADADSLAHSAEHTLHSLQAYVETWSRYGHELGLQVSSVKQEAKDAGASSFVLEPLEALCGEPPNLDEVARQAAEVAEASERRAEKLASQAAPPGM